MTAKVELRLEGPMDHLRLAWQTGETLLASVPFVEDPDSTRYNILLSVQELLTNVLRHGYQERDDESCPVRIAMEATTEGFAFELRDRGVRFDPLAHDVVPEQGEGAELHAGGYGIVIVKMVMDQLSYSHEDGWNILRAEKFVHSAVAMGAAGNQA